MRRLLEQRLYLDANALIYFAEAHPMLGQPIRAIFELAWRGRVSLVTSELSLAEVLVLPFKLGREDLVATYLDIVKTSLNLDIVAVDRAILVESARQRAGSSRKLPDSIHVATALQARCAFFISEDRNIRTPTGIEHVLISDLVTNSVSDSSNDH